MQALMKKRGLSPDSTFCNQQQQQQQTHAAHISQTSSSSTFGTSR
jgi:hypothetical protein